MDQVLNFEFSHCQQVLVLENMRENFREILDFLLSSFIFFVGISLLWINFVFENRNEFSLIDMESASEFVA